MAKTRVPVIAGFKDFAASVFGELIDNRNFMAELIYRLETDEDYSTYMANFCLDCTRRWLEDDLGVEELCRLLNMRNGEDKGVAHYLGDGKFFMSSNSNDEREIEFHTKEHYEAGSRFKKAKSQVNW